MEKHLLFLFVALDVAAADLFEVAQEEFRLVALPVEALQAGQCILGLRRIRRIVHHGLVVFDRLVVFAAVGVDQRQFQQGFRVVVVSLHAQQGEEALRSVFFLAGLHVSTSQFEERLWIERRRAVEPGHLLEQVDLFGIVAHQSVGDGRLKHGIEVLGGRIRLVDFLIGLRGVGVFALHEAGIPEPGLRVALILFITVRHVKEVAEVIFRIDVVAALEVAVRLVIQGLRIFGTVAEIPVGQQAAVDGDGFGPALVPEAALRQPEAGQVGQLRVVARGGGFFQQGLGSPVALAFDQLHGPQERGLLQIGRRLGRMDADGGEGLHGGTIVLREQEGRGHVVVDDVVLAAGGPAFHIGTERRDVGVHIERQLRKIEERVFLDHFVEITGSSGLEGVERGDLLLGLQVAVGGIIPGVLSQFIFFAQDMGERFDGGRPGLEAVRHDARQIVVFAAEFHPALGVDIHVAARFLLVPLFVPGLGQDARERTLHLLVQLVEKRLAAPDHIVVVLEHQLAFHGEIIGHLRELVVLPHLLEEQHRLLELLAEIMDIAFVIGAGDGILGVRTGQHLGEAFLGPLIAAGAHVAVGFLEREVGAAVPVKVVGVDGIVDGEGLHVLAGIEIARSQGLADHGLLRGVGILDAEGIDQSFGVDLVERDGAHHLVSLDFRTVQRPQRLFPQFGEGFFRSIISTTVIEFSGRFEAVGMLPVLHLAPGRQRRQKQQKDRCA